MKKVLSLVLALACVLSLSVVAFADEAATNVFYNSDGEVSKDAGNPDIGDGYIKADPVIPKSTLYVALGGKMNQSLSNLGEIEKVTVEQLADKDLFKFSIDKDDGAKLIKSISVKSDYRLGDLTRTAYLVIEFNDVLDTDEHKASGDIEFKARKTKVANQQPGSDKAMTGVGADSVWEKDEVFTISYNFWVSNDKVTNDGNPDIGDRVYFDPDKNDTNTIIWGDDRAALKFESDDDARKFYARLSTSNMSDIYAEYGDPVDADLWFYDFVGHPTVPATSKATLTLGIPWDDDDDYTPDPENCFIYEVDADGYLVDVTSKFTYSEDDEEIPGWSIRTRQLGTYIVSDTELDVAVDEPETSEPADVETPTNNGKDIPNTGSSDMVNVALVAAVVSLAAAGAVAFRKVK